MTSISRDGDGVITEDSLGLRGCLRIPHEGTNRLGIPTQSFPLAERHVGFYVKYQLLLSDFNQNWNAWTDFRKIPQH
jgi:hypothetical protein